MEPWLVCYLCAGTPFDLVLTNAVYFKGYWEYAFKKEATKQQAFNLEGGSTAQVGVYRTLNIGTPASLQAYVSSIQSTQTVLSH